MVFLEYWASHSELDKVRWIQAKSADTTNQEHGDQEHLSDYSDSEGHASGGTGDTKLSDTEEDESESSAEEPNYATNKFAALAEDD